jgi:nitrogen regulatory protein PII-like uncharacterized protein
MINFEQKKLELLMDMDKVIKAIDDEVDTFIVSRMHPNQKVRKIADKAYERKSRNTIRIAEEMIKKYG